MTWTGGVVDVTVLGTVVRKVVVATASVVELTTPVIVDVALMAPVVETAISEAVAMPVIVDAA